MFAGVPVAQPSGGRSPAIELERASVQLGGKTIWSDVTMRMGAGEFVAILGPTASGKSTLLNAILGLVPLAAGEIACWAGRPARRTTRSATCRSGAASIRRCGSAASTSCVSGSTATGTGIPLAGRAASRRERGAPRSRSSIELVGAGDYADRPIGQCSGGEQQRLLIAQALARRPPLLLLDEPLDSLDLPNQAVGRGARRADLPQ